MRQSLRFGIGVLLLGCLSCFDRAVAPYPHSAPPVPSDSALGAADLFEVKVAGEAELSGTYQVAQDGTINFPLIGRLPVAGKTLPEVEADLQGRLQEGYLRRPYVTARMMESRSKKVSVLGAVRTPGTFPYVENMSVIEAVTRAGGFAPLAKRNAVKVTRDGNGQGQERTGSETETILVAAEDIVQGKAPNFHLRPGDVVFVPERIF